jgi:hypothetical protein
MVFLAPVVDKTRGKAWEMQLYLGAKNPSVVQDLPDALDRPRTSIVSRAKNKVAVTLLRLAHT